jgi:hypothetical protein
VLLLNDCLLLLLLLLLFTSSSAPSGNFWIHPRTSLASCLSCLYFSKANDESAPSYCSRNVLFQTRHIFHWKWSYDKSRDSSVGITLGYGLDDRGSRVRFTAGARNFSLHHRVQNGSGSSSQPPIQGVWGALSLGVKRPGFEADHLPPCSAEVKEWVELYFHSPNTPPWRGAQLKHKDNFTFTFYDPMILHSVLQNLSSWYTSLNNQTNNQRNRKSERFNPLAFLKTW